MTLMTFNLPDPGEGLVEAEIVTWRVAVGDEVAVNDVVVEVETAKSLVELPIPWAGRVAELLVAEGDTVEVGSPIIRIDVPDSAGSASASAPASSAAVAEAAPAREPNLVGYGAITGSTTRRRRATPSVTGTRGAPSEPACAERPPAQRPLAAPPVRALAREAGVDLASVVPTGPGGVVTREDVVRHAGLPAVSAVSAVPATQGSSERETRIPVKGVRKVTAEAMVSSAFTAPHVTEFITVDVTATKELMSALAADREWRDVRITELLFVAKALLIACRRHPGVNATWDEASGEIVVKHYVNLGIAAATPRGLLVPNIKNADTMSLRELADAVNALVVTARDGKTSPAEMSSGTITITNVGVFGIDAGTPIINPGESAILCFGAVRRQPWVVTRPDGSEAVEPRWVTQLSLSFDHRLIDGSLGSQFLADIATVLANPALALAWA